MRQPSMATGAPAQGDPPPPGSGGRPPTGGGAGPTAPSQATPLSRRGPPHGRRSLLHSRNYLGGHSPWETPPQIIARAQKTTKKTIAVAMRVLDRGRTSTPPMAGRHTDRKCIFLFYEFYLFFFISIYSYLFSFSIFNYFPG